MDPTEIHSKHFPIRGNPATEFLSICIILPETSKSFMPSVYLAETSSLPLSVSVSLSAIALANLY